MLYTLTGALHVATLEPNDVALLCFDVRYNGKGKVITNGLSLIKQGKGHGQQQFNRTSTPAAYALTQPSDTQAVIDFSRSVPVGCVNIWCAILDEQGCREGCLRYREDFDDY